MKDSKSVQVGEALIQTSFGDGGCYPSYTQRNVCVYILMKKLLSCFIILGLLFMSHVYWYFDIVRVII